MNLLAEYIDSKNVKSFLRNRKVVQYYHEEKHISGEIYCV